jgi:protein-disulfide isomerase
MKKFYLLFGAVAAVGLSVVGYNVSAGVFSSAVSTPVEVEGLDDPETLVALARGVTKGDKAPITIVEFGDYQCPGCGAFGISVKPLVEQTYVETGLAQFVFYDFPLIGMHPNAFLAARAARCAEDQGKFWEYHDELFRNQARWSPLPNPGGSFRDYSDTVGMDAKDFASCLNSDRHADVVTANMQLGQMMGVSSTPTILVNMGGSTRRAPGSSLEAIALTIEAMSAPEPGAN